MYCSALDPVNLILQIQRITRRDLYVQVMVVGVAIRSCVFIISTVFVSQ